MTQTAISNHSKMNLCISEFIEMIAYGMNPYSGFFHYFQKIFN